MQFADSLTLDAPKRTPEGYLITRARAARTGVYQYSGREVDPTNDHGLRDKAVVNVLRDTETVFDKAASLSFVGKPVTDDHPSVSVTADNWKEHARGTIMGALRDGEYLAFDLLITDASAIKKVDAGKRELSNGYAAELEYGEFKAPDGTLCDARQARITGGNHVALVKDGRAGSQCAITDNSNGGNTFAACDANPAAISGLSTGEIKMKITLDGVSVTLTDATEVQAAFDKIKADAVSAADAAKTALEAETAKVVTLTADAVTKDAEIVSLKADVAANAITPEKLRDAAKAYAVVTDQAKALGVTVTDAMDEAAIKKAVVDAKMGDAAKDYTADHIEIAFTALTKDVKAEDGKVVPIGHIKPVNDAATDVKAAQAARMARLSNAHRAA